MMPRTRVARLVLVVVAVLMLAACSGSPPARTTHTTTATTAAAPPASSKDLQEARRQAGIKDCPATPSGQPGAGGLPDLTLACLGSTRQVGLAGLRGPMVINVWAQWCRPCRIEAPHLASVARQSKGKVAFIGVDYGDPDPAAAIAFAREAGWHYPQLQDFRQQLKGPLKIIGVPQTYLVDAHGKVVFQQVRPVTSDAQLRKLIHDHLGVTL